MVATEDKVEMRPVAMGATAGMVAIRHSPVLAEMAVMPATAAMQPREMVATGVPVGREIHLHPGDRPVHLAQQLPGMVDRGAPEEPEILTDPTEGTAIPVKPLPGLLVSMVLTEITA